jgi:hypothetical protein
VTTKGVEAVRRKDRMLELIDQVELKVLEALGEAS